MRHLSVFSLAVLAAALWAGDEKPAEPTPGLIDFSTLELYTDPRGAYTVRIPAGYHRLSEDENREVFKGLSQILGKEVEDRVLRQPPTWFRGALDPKKPHTQPPAIAITYTDFSSPIDPKLIDQYKQQIEEGYRKNGVKTGELDVKVIKVAGLDALRVEHDEFSVIDNTRSRVIMVSIPGPQRRYDVRFAFGREQADGVEVALATVLATFSIKDAPGMDAKAQSKWTRVAIWTVGAFFVGVLISIFLRILSGAGQREPEESGG